mgnify:CR=1 FL=1
MKSYYITHKHAKLFYKSTKINSHNKNLQKNNIYHNKINPKYKDYV